MRAAGYGYQRIVRLLLERGADPRLADSDGASALDYAVRGVADLDHITAGGCQTEIVRHVLQAAPDLRLEADSWALKSARLKRCEEIVEMVAPEGG